MSTVVKDLGAVSAYAYAVEKGYTGTEAEFAELMADYAEVGQRAEDAADSALESKTAAQTAATTATNKASEATTAAQTATTKAGEAQTSAQTASSKASEAVGCVETATQKATEATQSASQALGYKNDAESAKTASQTAQGLAESARDSAISAKNDAESARDDAQEIVDGINAKAEQIDTNTADIAELESTKADLSELYKAFPTDTASGAIASFSDGADGIPLKSLVVDINPIQDLSHGDPSPENICPISGWTQVDVNHSGADMTNPTTITINLGQTVYGGTLDVLSGELIIDRAMVDLGTLEWMSEESYVSGQFRVSQQETRPLNPNYSSVQCSILKGVGPRGYTQFNNGEIGLSNSPTDPMIRAKSEVFIGKTAEEIKAIMQGQQLVYELAEPITIQLTPNQVNSLLGVNNIWADSGDTTCVYRADTKLFIERLTAPDSADMIADANITSGQYFMVGNSLYKATANIANGAQIIVGTNCIRKSLSEALNEINA